VGTRDFALPMSRDVHRLVAAVKDGQDCVRCAAGESRAAGRVLTMWFLHGIPAWKLVSKRGYGATKIMPVGAGGSAVGAHENRGRRGDL